LKCSFAAEGAGTNALEKQKRDGSSSTVRPQAILERSFAAEGAGTNGLEKRKRGQVKFEGPRSIPAASTAAEVAASMDAEARLG